LSIFCLFAHFQGIKKGIVEMADVIVVTKSDGDLAKRAALTQYEYMNAIKFMTPKNEYWYPRVVRCSATTAVGMMRLISF
jgi:LAO/AO transport system kinase